MRSLLLFGVVTIVVFAAQAQQKIDGIAAVVGDEIILKSELEAYTELRLGGMGLSRDTIDLSRYTNTFLNELIDGKILLVHGKKDSTVSVTEEEVDQATDNHIAMLLRQNNLTMDSLEVELRRQQGISLSKFRSDARKVIREQLIKQKVQQSYFFGTKVSRKDVEAFYAEYRDSLPKMGESILLSQLSLKISPAEAVRQKAYERIKSIKARLDNGADFAELAKQFSEGPEAQEGGDLGFISKGTLSELLFEEKAFSLSPGKISDPFETRLGFHILNVVERRDQRVHIRQIFIKVEPQPEEIERVRSRLDSIKTVCRTLDDFRAAVNAVSDEPVSRSTGGRLKWISVLELPSAIRSVVDSLPVGSISEPVQDNQYMSIYRVNERVADRVLTLEDDYPVLEKKANDITAQKKLIKLVAQWRKDVYIEIRI